MKHLWILELNSAQFLFYHSFTSEKLDGFLISGLLTAFNAFSESEIGKNECMESIEMSGLRWLYSSYPKENIQIVVAANKADNTIMLKARIDVIAEMFSKQYKSEYDKRAPLAVNLAEFEPFHLVLDSFQQEWTEAEKLMDVGRLFDLLGVFQQIFIIIINIINKSCPQEKMPEILIELNSFTPKLEAENMMKDGFRLIELFFPKINLNDGKISFNKSLGLSIAGVTPIGLDANELKSMFCILLINYKTVIANCIGEDLWLKTFNRELRPFLFSRWDFLLELGLIRELLEIFMENDESNCR